MVQPRLLAWTQIKMNDVGKVTTAKARVQAQERRFPLGDFADPRAAAPLRFQQRFFHIT